MNNESLEDKDEIIEGEITPVYMDMSGNANVQTEVVTTEDSGASGITAKTVEDVVFKITITPNIVQRILSRLVLGATWEKVSKVVLVDAEGNVLGEVPKQ